MKEVLFFDDVLRDPLAYRQQALALSFGDVAAGNDVFHGIAVCTDPAIPSFVAAKVTPSALPQLSFFRQSPEGQREPNYIHSDQTMGDLTGIFYLTPRPPDGDGTSFWRHRESGATSGPFNAAEAQDLGRWERWEHVTARFNRLLIFQSDLFHSRGLIENYGRGKDARLIQVVFWTRPKRGIRRATLSDVPAIVALAQAFVAETPYHLHITLDPVKVAAFAEQLIPNPDAFVMVAEGVKGLEGMLAMMMLTHPMSGERVASEVVWWMNPASRGSGVRLLKQAEQWARSQDAAAMHLVAPTARVGSFYSKVGYVPVETGYQRRLR
jgi:N-acetylglutamate synthase-like GNAT family acetyltransferase